MKSPNIAFKDKSGQQSTIDVHKSLNLATFNDEFIFKEECFYQDFSYVKAALNLLAAEINNDRHEEISNILRHIEDRPKLFRFSKAISYLFPEDFFFYVFSFCFNNNHMENVCSALKLLRTIIKGSKAIDNYLLQQYFVDTFLKFLQLPNENINFLVIEIISRLSKREPNKVIFFWFSIKNKLNIHNTELISRFIFNEIECFPHIESFNYSELFLVMNQILGSYNIPAKCDIWMAINKSIEMKNPYFIEFFVNENNVLKLAEMAKSYLLDNTIKNGFIVLKSFIPYLDPNIILSLDFFSDIENIIGKLHRKTVQLHVLKYLIVLYQYHSALMCNRIDVDKNIIKEVIELYKNDVPFNIRLSCSWIFVRYVQNEVVSNLFSLDFSFSFALLFDLISSDSKSAFDAVNCMIKLCNTMLLMGADRNSINILISNQFESDRILQECSNYSSDVEQPLIILRNLLDTKNDE